NDPDVTKRTTAAFRSHFSAGTLFDLGHQTASEDFSDIPNALSTPYISARTRGRAGGAGYPRQSLVILRAGHRANPIHGHPDPGDRRVGVSGGVMAATVAAPSRGTNNSLIVGIVLAVVAFWLFAQTML